MIPWAKVMIIENQIVKMMLYLLEVIHLKLKFQTESLMFNIGKIGKF